jgi:hypothetical protein
MSNIPTDPDEILEKLAPLSKLLHIGLESGGQEVRQYFSRRAHDLRKRVELNKPVATGLVRYVALTHLTETRGVGCEYHLEEVNNNGIAVRYPWCHIKVYKGMGGEPPTAHNTRRNRSFYGQDLNPYLPNVDWKAPWRSADWDEIAKTLNCLNLIYCWEADPRYNITQLQLFCPRKSGKYKEGVRLFWRRTVPHPIYGINVATVNDEQDVDDLPVFFEDAGEQDEDG